MASARGRSAPAAAKWASMASATRLKASVAARIDRSIARGRSRILRICARSGQLIDIYLLSEDVRGGFRARHGCSSDIALDHHPLMTVAERFDPVLRAAALDRQQAHDLERIGRRALKRALFQGDVLANGEFP